MKGKKRLLFGGVSLLMSAAMLAGTTFAWFTDTVANKNNRVEAGTLELALNQGETQPLFRSENVVWEPGFSQEAGVTLENTGSLWLKYTLSLANVQTTGTSDVTEVLDVYKVDGIEVSETDLTDDNKLGTLADLAKQGTLEDEAGVLAPEDSTEGDSSDTFTLVIKMQETAGNEYQNCGVSFDIQASAAQYPYEEDGFGSNDYDADAPYGAVSVSTEEELAEMLEAGKPVSLENDITLTKKLEVTGDVTIEGNGHTLDISDKDDRVINVSETDKPVTITLKNVDMPSPTTGAYTRGISFYETGEVTLVMDGCSLGANYYAINSAFGNDKITAVIRNSTITGWAVLNTHSPYANLTFENCTLIGNNDKPYNADGWNGFATFVFDNASGNPDPDGAHDCTVNFKNCRIEANSLTGNAQFFFSIRAINTTINAENCTFVKDGQELTTLEEIASNISVRDYAADSFVFNLQ